MRNKQYSFEWCDSTKKNMLVVETAWNKEIENYVKENGIDYLYFNHVKGWIGNDLNFLENINHIKYLNILDHSIKDISGINALQNLELLRVCTSCKTVLNFKNFRNLKRLSFDWVKGSDSLFECDSLEGLGLQYSEEKNFKRFSKLKNLRSLAIDGKIESLDGIEQIERLTRLVLIDLRKLSSIAPLSKALNINELTINGCRNINNIDSIGCLIKLERLELDSLGEIESIKKLSTLKELKTISFHDSTNIMDGDLSVLEKLPKLHMVKFNNRKHYSHKRQDLDKSVDYELLKKEDARIRELIKKVKQEKAQKK